MGGILTVCKFRVAVLSEMLDASDIMGVIDMQKLRLIASSGMSVAYCIFLRIRWDCWPVIVTFIFSGIPESPPWLRPRVWKYVIFLNVRRPVVLMEYYWYRLLFNLVPPAKVHWETEIRTKRESYYVSYQWIKPHWPLKLQGRTWSAGYLTKYQASLPHQRIKSFSHWWNH